MLYSRVAEDKYLIRLKRGELVNESLKKFCQKMEIKNGAIFAIGSVLDPTLAHYKVDNKKYSQREFKGVFEVTPMNGNIGLNEGQVLIHNHIVISDESFQAYGGHLVEAQVSATLEVILIKFDSNLTKSFDEEIGLKLYDLNKLV